MRVYEVRVEKVTSDWDRNEGYETIGYTVNQAKAEEVAKAWAEEHERNQWWMCYGKKNGHINVEIVDRGEVIE